VYGDGKTFLPTPGVLASSLGLLAGWVTFVDISLTELQHSIDQAGSRRAIAVTAFGAPSLMRKWRYLER
jgi:hypothetical protein